MRIPLASQAYTSAVPDNSREDLINLYPEKSPEGSRFPFVLIGTAGLKSFATAGSGPIRGRVDMGGELFVVSGNEFYRVEEDTTITLLGTVAGSGTVSMAHNGTQIIIVVPGGKGYVATRTTITEITDGAFLTADTVTYADGYFVFSRTGNSGEFFWSALNDGSLYDALDFATAETDPDALVAVFTDHQELVLFGTKTIDFYRNTGAPFARLNGATAEKGSLARFSIAKVDNSFMWLGHDYTVYRMDERTPIRISTHTVEKDIRSYANPENAEAMAYTERGHAFYGLKFDEASWFYDSAVNRWHKKKSKDRDNYRAGHSVLAFKKNIAGDDRNGNLFEMDPDTFDDNGDEIVRVVDFPYVHAEGRQVFFSRFEGVFAPGVGLTTGQGSDPQAMMRYSDDGGKSFSNELWRSGGKIGEYAVLAIWNRLGKSRRRLFRLTLSDPVEWRILGANLEADIGSS